MKHVKQFKDTMGNVIASLEPSDTVYNIVLVANTSQQFAIPAGAKFVRFSTTSGADLLVKFANSSITWPSINVADGTGAELNPWLTICEGKTYVSVLSNANCILGMSFYL